MYRSKIFLTMLLMLSPSLTKAWSDHHYITREALQNTIPPQQLVVYVSIETLLKELKLKDPVDLNVKIKINKNYVFKNKLEEVENQNVPILDILSTYSDEPDWGMDQELFSNDQYPDLWKPEYAMMGGTTGLSSQAFRHMYWRELYWKHPIQSLKLPLEKSNESMGEAPDRAALFVQLAHFAFQHKLDYWGWRFTALSLHYIEDLSQPYHTSQVPSKLLINMVLAQCVTEFNCNNFILRMTHIISYYHFAFEDTVSTLFVNRNQFQPSAKIISALTQNESKSYLNKMPEEISIMMANLANEHSARAGNSSIYFFPFYSDSYLNFDPGNFMDQKWWSLTSAKLNKNSSAKDMYLNTVSTMFYELGDAVRCWIQNMKNSMD